MTQPFSWLGEKKGLWSINISERYNFLMQVARYGIETHNIHTHLPELNLQPDRFVITYNRSLSVGSCIQPFHRLLVMVVPSFYGAKESRGPVSRKSRNFSGRNFGWHNSLCIFKTMASGVTKLRLYFNFYFLYNIWKHQLYRISWSEVSVLRMAFWARNVFGTFEKRVRKLVFAYWAISL